MVCGVASVDSAGELEDGKCCYMVTSPGCLTRHAELAWRAVAWAIREGGEPVTRAVRAAFAEALAAPPSVPNSHGGDDADLPRHGRLGANILAAVFARGIAEVIEPAVQGLLASSRPGVAS